MSYDIKITGETKDRTLKVDDRVQKNLVTLFDQLMAKGSGSRVNVVVEDRGLTLELDNMRVKVGKYPWGFKLDMERV